MNPTILVLSNGYVRLVESWGAGDAGSMEETRRPDFEVGIIEAARQSTQGSFRGWSDDAKLLTYLYQNKHSTPFEFAGMVLEIQAPIFVFREWHRHRTQSYNEMSARYVPLPDLYYLPNRQRVLQPSEGNKQAAGVRPEPASADYITQWLANVEHLYRQAEDLYQTALHSGIPKELARITMPLGHFSKMRAAANLRNWLAFLTLRADPKAQWEIRQYAEAVGAIIQKIFPRTYELFRSTER